MTSQLLAPIQTPASATRGPIRFISRNPAQFQWRVILQQNLSWLYAHHPNLFVVGDLFWYPTTFPGQQLIEPDVMIVVNRIRWQRNDDDSLSPESIEPLVVFEVQAPRNGQVELDRKLLFYERYGAAEYYTYDPSTHNLQGWLLENKGLEAVSNMNNWVSPYLGIRFVKSSEGIALYRPNGEPFANYTQIAQWAEELMPAPLLTAEAHQVTRYLDPTLSDERPTLQPEQVAQTLGLTTGLV